MSAPEKIVVQMRGACLLCDWFRCYSKPGIVGHVDAFVIPREDGVSLGEVSVKAVINASLVFSKEGNSLLDIPRYLVLPSIMVTIIGKVKPLGWLHGEACRLWFCNFAHHRTHWRHWDTCLCHIQDPTSQKRKLGFGFVCSG